jgi:hypothetical protein
MPTLLEPAPIVRKLSPYRFTLTYPDDPEFVLRMNFQPIVDGFSLTGNYSLLHWQAKPKGLRRWGCFSMRDGETQYQAFQEVSLGEFGYFRGIQVNENLVRTVPTAVLWLPNAVCVAQESGVGKIVAAGVSNHAV